ncbi:MAG TPA: hypothetical protein VFF24_00425 [Acidimicrobiia bacterium]|nr:hypothetical protein [Acidimicrobiia bacterium]
MAGDTDRKAGEEHRVATVLREVVQVDDARRGGEGPHDGSQ